MISGMVAFYLLLVRKSRAARMLENVPGPPTLPFVGNALDLNVSNEYLVPVILGWNEKYGSRFVMYVGLRPYIVLTHAVEIEKILSSPVHIEKSRDYDFLFPWLGSGLLTSKDDFLVVINEQSQNMVQILKQKYKKAENFDICHYITLCALDIICETAMGKAINAQNESDSEYVKAIYRISELIQHRQVRPWLHPNFIWRLSPSGKEEKRCLNILHGFTKNVIQERKREKQLQKEKGSTDAPVKPETEDDIYTKGKKRLAFLDLLLDAQEKEGNNLTDQDIREETDTFMFEKILSSNIHIDKSEDYSVLHPWLGTGLLTASGPKWVTRRKLLTPTFHFKILEEFLQVFNEQSRVFVDVLKSEHGHGDKFDILPYVTRCALDIISETAMGKKLHAQKADTTSAYIEALYGINEILTQRLTKYWLRINWVWKLSSQGRAEKKYLRILHKFTEDVIRERKEIRQRENNSAAKNTENDSPFETKKRMAFLDLLLDAKENGHGLSDLDIREEVDTFMFEDTTAANLSFTIFLLATYPEYQKRVQVELDEIFGSDKTINITSKHLAEMKYLECCVKESLRIYPSVGFIMRVIKQDIVICDGQQTIPKGTGALVSPFMIHRDPKVFPDPEKFDPDRFLLENTIGRNPFAYVPFSAGPRNCIGQKFALMEEKIILASLLRNFNLEAVDKREDVLLVPDIILRPVGGLHIKISPRL